MPDDFPTIPGIDRVRAVQILGDNRTLFLRLLDGLVTEFAGAVEQTRRDLAQGDREAATRRLHTLRGNAGNLGALDLMRTAGALEEALRAGRTELEPGLATLERQLEDVTAASAPWRRPAALPSERPATGEPAVALRPADVATLHPQVQALAVMLDNGDGKACQLSTAIEELLAGTALEHAYAPIARAIDDLNFKAALEDLRALAREQDWREL